MKKIILSALLLPLLALSACQQWSGMPSLGARPQNDNNITTSVQAALDNSGLFVNVPITIETKHHEVMLSGYVKTIRQSDVAADLASKTPGVTKVSNHLIVRK